MKKTLLVAASAAAFAFPVYAQNPAPGSAGPGTSAPGGPNAGTGTYPSVPAPRPGGAARDTTNQRMQNVDAQTFSRMAAMSNQFEIQSSQLAQQKARSAEVKAFAQDMIKDHQMAAQRMKAVMAKANASGDMTTGSVMDEKHQAIMTKLKSASGAEFDRAYVEAQMQAHEEAVALFTAYSQSGDDPQLKQFASEMLPTLEQHREHIMRISKDMMSRT